MLVFRFPLKSALVLSLGLSAFLSLSPAQAQMGIQWEQGQNPSAFLFPDEKLETHFNKLQTVSDVTYGGAEAPWSETYWPAKKGGIAARYLDSKANAFKVDRPSEAEIKAMTPEQIRNFSPAEKFDILNGDYDFPFTQRVLAPYDSSMPSWNGICHGWVPAAINYPEPQPITVKNKDGIEIQFGSSDIKGLISFYYAWEAAEFDEQGVDHFAQVKPIQIPFAYRQLGERCDQGLGKCKGHTLNPAAFHLALANVMGNYHRSFVVNVDPTQQVWNQPAYGYSSQVLEETDIGANTVTNEDGTTYSDGAVKKLLVNTEFTYVQEPAGPRFEARGGNAELGDNAVIKATKHLAYYLYLNQDGEIVGGDWARGFFKSKSKRTDFIGFAWRASRVPFTGKFKILNDLYKAKTRKTFEYAEKRNYTPALDDMYFNKNASEVPAYDWSAAK
jgi:hypothetical protein